MGSDVIGNLDKNGISPEDFVVSTDRLVKAAVMTQDDEQINEIIDRTVRLTGVGRQAAHWFVAWRIAIGLDSAVRAMDKER
jgi:hypothetical protein